MPLSFFGFTTQTNVCERVGRTLGGMLAVADQVRSASITSPFVRATAKVRMTVRAPRGAGCPSNTHLRRLCLRSPRAISALPSTSREVKRGGVSTVIVSV
jgi:hypothetical protein